MRLGSSRFAPAIAAMLAAVTVAEMAERDRAVDPRFGKLNSEQGSFDRITIGHAIFARHTSGSHNKRRAKQRARVSGCGGRRR